MLIEWGSYAAILPFYLMDTVMAFPHVETLLPEGCGYQAVAQSGFIRRDTGHRSTSTVWFTCSAIRQLARLVFTMWAREGPRRREVVVGRCAALVTLYLSVV